MLAGGTRELPHERVPPFFVDLALPKDWSVGRKIIGAVLGGLKPVLQEFPTVVCGKRNQTP